MELSSVTGMFGLIPTRRPFGRAENWQSGTRKTSLNMSKTKELIVDYRKKPLLTGL
jgi:hypothetical protein